MKEFEYFVGGGSPLPSFDSSLGLVVSFSISCGVRGLDERSF